MDNFPNLLARQNDSNEPITSHPFSFHGDRWRGIITPQLDMFLQLVSSVNAVTAEMKYERIEQSSHWIKIYFLGEIVPKFEPICLFTYLKQYESFGGIHVT